MAKVITFSRVFPSYHPRAGQPTYFVEQIWNGFRGDLFDLPDSYIPFVREYVRLKAVGEPLHLSGVKCHTIRGGNRFKAGDWFKPVVWGDDINPKSGRKGPYQSKQIQFAPDIQVKKTWPYHIYMGDHFRCELIGDCFQGEELSLTDLIDVSCNDGLGLDEFKDWFQLNPLYKKDQAFSGQIICWNEDIEY